MKAWKYLLKWNGVVWCGLVWCGLVWCGVGWCGVILGDNGREMVTGNRV